MKKITLAFCRGSNEGSAIYLNTLDEDGSGGGSRVAGPKCWGYIQTVKAFNMSEDDLKFMIDSAKNALKELKNSSKKKK